MRDHEALVERLKPAKVIAIALDTSALSAEEARKAIAQTAKETGLPVEDPVATGQRPVARDPERRTQHAEGSGSFRRVVVALALAAGALHLEGFCRYDELRE